MVVCMLIIHLKHMYAYYSFKTHTHYIYIYIYIYINGLYGRLYAKLLTILHYFYGVQMIH